jgi:hypothetical protein
MKINRQTLSKRTQIVLIIQCICMLIGTTTHLRWILTNGIFVHQEGIPFISTIFWDSLVFFDFVAALFLLFKPKIGVLITLIIITVDVIHNNIFLILSHQHINEINIKIWIFTYWEIICQILFMLFVFGTLKRNWIDLK